MRKLHPLLGLLLALVSCSMFAVAHGAAQTQPAQQTVTKSGDKSKANAEALKKYAGRYELETGIIPVSTLDVTFEGGELWLKPSNVKKRRLLHKSKTRFTDELTGTPVKFTLDDEGKIASLTFLYEGEPYTAQRVELPPPSLKGNTTFRLAGHADASLVILTGSFNEWNQSQLVFGREGDAWVCRIDLDPGVYQYKFVVDGNWLLDPSNPETAEDEAGNVNNLLEVKPKP